MQNAEQTELILFEPYKKEEITLQKSEEGIIYLINYLEKIRTENASGKPIKGKEYD
jgi:hypothetical protein